MGQGSDTTMGDGQGRAAVLRSGMSIGGLTVEELWRRCIALGDKLTPAELNSALGGELTLSDHQHNVVAQAINDRLIELGLDHLVPYTSEV